MEQYSIRKRTHIMNETTLADVVKADMTMNDMDIDEVVMEIITLDNIVIDNITIDNITADTITGNIPVDNAAIGRFFSSLLTLVPKGVSIGPQAISTVMNSVKVTLKNEKSTKK